LDSELESKVRRLAGVDDAWSATGTRVGNGQVAECHRWTFRQGDQLRTVVSKSPSTDETSRATASAQRLYQRETSFYRELQPHVSICTPKPLAVEYDATTDDFLILLEDLAPARDIDQFTGMHLDDAALALSELAGLHAPTAGNTALFAAPWLGGVNAALQPLYVAVLPALFAQFLERYDDVLKPATRQTVERLGNKLLNFGMVTPAVSTVLHGDYRSENMLFGGRDGEVPLAVVDWQTVMSGSPLLDVAYFLVTSLTGEVRRAHEQELLAHYVREMATRGVTLHDADVRSEYARYTLQPVLMLVGASIMVVRTERGDAMFLTMIDRAVEAVEEWNAFEVIG
jgi:hypothetical protein